ncbi:hypothetical protein HOLleu_27485 [Holothuria leucospilota]|uniref:Uncharacterized protein n=1 Tax=Holothuria leucospilota TaxID=206669 RepID=A0A9Q1BQU0_HOLLE|nr:hypothetical protein HOLleu_27485 [Holothuria leucospilota]
MEESELSFEEISTWTVASLKDYLRIRGLKQTGNKTKLIALVYGASQLGVQPKPNEVEEDRKRSEQYRKVLNICGKTLPDPLSELNDNWKGEKEGVHCWPPVSYYEIAEWLLRDAPCVSQPSIRDKKRASTLHDRLLSDYKEGKAYSYFSSKWLHEILYHDVESQSPVCYVKANCTPSQAIKNVPHTAWVALSKESGKVFSAYCTCFAGLGSTCNHIAAILFKLDHAFMTGKSRKEVACTSKQCTWNVYSGGQSVIKGKPVSELQWFKPTYTNTKKKPINTLPRKLFNPTCSSKKSPSTQGLYNAMLASCQDSTLFRYLEDDHKISTPIYPHDATFNEVLWVSKEVEVETIPNVPIPQPLPALAVGTNTISEFLDQLPEYTVEEVSQIEIATRGQFDNPQWKRMREGRITASKLKSVVSRNKTLHSDDSNHSKDPVPIIKQIMGYETINENIPNLKYGRLMEPKAREVYRQLLHEQGHQDLSIRECGLFVDPQNVFIGASPDALVDCSCCSSGVLEIKCPRSVIGEKPTPSNYKPLSHTTGLLDKQHAYFFQCQAQMAVTKRLWCDFFVYSQESFFYLERIHFNESLWDEAVPSAKQFFSEYIVPELLTNKIRKEVQSQTVPYVPADSKHAEPPQTQDTVVSIAYEHNETPSSSNEGFIIDKGKRKFKGRILIKGKRHKGDGGANPIYLCKVCQSACKDEVDIDTPSYFSIGCENCKSRYHWICVNITSPPSTDWFCKDCVHGQ